MGSVSQASPPKKATVDGRLHKKRRHKQEQRRIVPCAEQHRNQGPSREIFWLPRLWKDIQTPAINMQVSNNKPKWWRRVEKCTMRSVNKCSPFIIGIMGYRNGKRRSNNWLGFLIIVMSHGTQKITMDVDMHIKPELSNRSVFPVQDHSSVTQYATGVLSLA